MLKTIDLKKELNLIPQYVKLRNQYIKELLSSRVSLKKTLKWLDTANTEIYGLAKGKDLIGVILIYTKKQNEICLFVKETGGKVGGKLLEIADKRAVKSKITSLWAWTKNDNIAAIKIFERNGYKKIKAESRLYIGEKIQGYRFIKKFN